MKTKLKQEVDDYRILLRNVPALWLTFYCLSVVLMNLLANKELFNLRYLALDCGFLISWMIFLCDDIITKQFGTKASVKLTILALGINLCVSAIFFIVSIIPSGHWGQYYTYEESIIDTVLNSTIGGTWYVLLGSSIACLVSSFVNSIINTSIGKIYNHKHIDNFKSFAVRSYVSTSIGQFVDNLVFACIVSYVFFGWTAIQVFMCSLTGALFELLAEVLLSPIGYKVSKKWKQNNVGKEYLDYASKEIV